MNHSEKLKHEGDVLEESFEEASMTDIRSFECLTHRVFDWLG